MNSTIIKFIPLAVLATLYIQLTFAKSIKDVISDTSANQSSYPKSIAKVNNQPITLKEFHHILYQSAGLRVLRELISLKLAEQLAQKENIYITQKDIDTELDYILKETIPERDALGRKIPPSNKLKILKLLLKRQNISYEEFMLSIKRQAYLKKLAELKIKITPNQLKEEYNRLYGPKVKLRVIVVNSFKLAQKIVRLLEEGKDFTTLVKKYSIHFQSAVNDGLINPIAENDTSIPPAVRKVAFSLKKNQISNPISVDRNFWIIKIEQKIPPKNVKFEDVKSNVEESLKNRLIKAKIKSLEKKLLSSANVEIYNSQLRKLYKQWLKSYIPKSDKYKLLP